MMTKSWPEKKKTPRKGFKYLSKKHHSNNKSNIPQTTGYFCENSNKNKTIREADIKIPTNNLGAIVAGAKPTKKQKAKQKKNINLL